MAESRLELWVTAIILSAVVLIGNSTIFGWASDHSLPVYIGAWVWSTLNWVALWRFILLKLIGWRSE